MKKLLFILFLFSPLSAWATTQTAYPTGDHSYAGSGWFVTPASPTTKYDKVDEVTPDDTATYIMCTSNGAWVLFTASAFTVPTGSTIANVTVHYRGKRSTSANSGGCIYVSGTRYDGTPVALTNAWADYTTAWTTNPATGSAWTVSDVNETLPFGVFSNGTLVSKYYTQIYLTVDYTAPAERLLVGQVDVVSSTTGDVIKVDQLIGEMDFTSVVADATLQVTTGTKLLAGQVDFSSTTFGYLAAQERFLSGNVDNISDFSGDVLKVNYLTGSVAGNTNATGAIKSAHEKLLSGSLSASLQSWASISILQANLRNDLTEKFRLASGEFSSKPVTLIEFDFASGNLYASDHTVSVGSRSYVGLVTNWNKPEPFQVNGLMGNLGLDWEMEVSNIPITYNGYQKCFSEILSQNVPENTTVKIYQWFGGLTSSDPAEYERFYIGQYSYDRLTCKLKLTSPMRKFDKPLGWKINRTNFTKCSYGVVGQSLGYVYGSVDNVPLLPLSVGWQSALVEDIEATSTVGSKIYFRTDGTAGKVTDLPSSGSIIMGDEEIGYSSRSYASPISSTDTHNNYIVVSSRGSNARPYQMGTVATEKLSAYVYGFPLHASKALTNLRVNGITQSSNFSVNLNDTTTLTGHTLTTVSFTKHPRRLKGVGTHSHLAKRMVERAGTIGTAPTAFPNNTWNGFQYSDEFYSSVDLLPTNVGNPQKGILYVTAHLENLAQSSSADVITLQVRNPSGKFATTNTVFKLWATADGNSIRSVSLQIPISSPDWSADTFKAYIRAIPPFGYTGVLVVDAVKWEIEYTGGDSVNTEVKDRMVVAGSVGKQSFTTSPATLTMTAPVPAYVPTPQELYCEFVIRFAKIDTGGLLTVTVGGGSSKITQKILYFPVLTTSGNLETIRVKVNSPDLTQASFTCPVSVSINAGTGVFAVDTCTFTMQYASSNAEVISGIEVLSDGPAVTASVDGVFSGVPTSSISVDNGDTTTNWSSSDSTKMAISHETVTVHEGTGSVKAVVVTNDGGWQTNTILASQTTGSYNRAIYGWSAFKGGQYSVDVPVGAVLRSVDVKLSRTGNPTGHAYVKVYQSTSNPTVLGSLIATSAAMDVSSIQQSDVSYGLPFNLNFLTAPTLGSYTYGVTVLLEMDSDYVSDANNKIYLWYGSGNPSRGEQYIESGDGVSWNYVSYTSADLIYTLYGDIPIGGDNVVRSITKTISSTDLSNSSTLSVWFNSSVAGSKFTFQFSEDGTTWQSYPVTITNADVWEQTNWNITGISGSLRNGVTQLRVLVTDASVGFTLFVDDVRKNSAVVGTILSNPADVISDISTTLAGVGINASSFGTAKTAQGSFTFNGLVRDSESYLELLPRLLEQCRSKAWYSKGNLYLKYLPDALTSSRTIDKKAISQGIRISSKEEVINSVNVHYNQYKKDEYAGHFYTQDEASIGKYGTREKTFQWDFVKDYTMALSLSNFYLNRYNNVKKHIALNVMLDNFDLQISNGFAITDNASAISLTGATVFELENMPILQPGYIYIDNQGQRHVIADHIELKGREW